MYMHDCTRKESIRYVLAKHLKSQQLPCDNKLKWGNIKGFNSSKKNPTFQLKLETDLMVPIPKIFYDLSKFILGRAEQEWIFRKAGSKSRQEEMKMKIAQGQPWKNLDVDVIDIAALLKYYVRELPVALIPTAYHELFLACCEHENKEELLILSTLLLPSENLNLLSYLMIFFQRIANFSKYNKMDLYNIAVCVAPNILPVRVFSAEISAKTIEIIELLIKNADDIGVIPLYLQSQLDDDEKSSQSKLKGYFVNVRRRLISIFC